MKRMIALSGMLVAFGVSGCAVATDDTQTGSPTGVDQAIDQGVDDDETVDSVSSELMSAEEMNVDTDTPQALRAMSLAAKAELARPESPPKALVDPQPSVITPMRLRFEYLGPIRNRGTLAFTRTLFRLFCNFVAVAISDTNFSKFWGTSGTIYTDGKFRLDIQNPVNGAQNLQIQYRTFTLANVVVPTSFAALEGNPQVDITGQMQQREFIRRFRDAMLTSAKALMADPANNAIIRLVGSYSNGFGGRRKLLKYDPNTVENVGPIADQAYALKICPKVAAAQHGVWTGRWGRSPSTPDLSGWCVINPAFHLDGGAGILSRDVATWRCPQVCRVEELAWTGKWRMLSQPKTSTCEWL